MFYYFGSQLTKAWKKVGFSTFFKLVKSSYDSE